MKFHFKKLPGSKVELEVGLTKDDFLPYYEAAHSRALQSIHLKGFRPGTAPRDLAEKAVDRETVFNEAVKEAVRWSLDDASKNNEWTLIDAPHIEITDTKDLGLQYKANLTIFPEIKLGNYKKIARKILAERKESKVEPKEVDDVLNWIRNSREEGDPSTSSGQVKVPELNDEFAKSLGKFNSVEELRKNVTDGLRIEKDIKERDRLRAKILDDIIGGSEIDTPEIMIEKIYENLNKQYSSMMKTGGKSDEQIVKELRDKAKENVESNLVMYKIAKIEHLEPTEEEIHQRQGGVENEQNYQYYYGIVQNEKVFQFLENQ